MRRMIVRADGCSRGNPGPSACGIVVEHEGEVVFSGGRRLGRATNNVAEYEGLLYGLVTARQLGATAIEVRLDSELLVRQVEGSYKVRSPKLKGMHARAMAALKGFEEWSVVYVPREENKAADRAANDALDGRE